MTRLRAVAMAALLLCGAAAVHAQTSNNPYYIGASQTFTHDSNLLRVNEGTVVPAGYNRSDNISTTALLAGIDQHLGRQRAYGNVSLRNNRYGNNSFLNNQGYSLSGGLDWSTVERLSGTVTASANRSLQRFTSQEVGFLTDRNLQSAEAVNATANLGLVTRYSLEVHGGYQHIKNSLDLPSIKARDFDENNAGFALQWRPSSATMLGLGASSSQGRYPRFSTAPSGEYTADRFQRDTIDLTASLRPSGLSSFDARISSGKTRYDLNSARNFSGLTGSVAWSYQATGKWQFSANFSRDTGQDSYATSLAQQSTTANYAQVNNNFRFQSNYQATGKIALTAGLAYYDRRVEQSFSSQAATASGRDRTTTLSLGARWAPLRNVSLGCDYSNEDRRGTGSLGSLKDTIFGCFGQITLQ